MVYPLLQCLVIILFRTLSHRFHILCGFLNQGIKHRLFVSMFQQSMEINLFQLPFVS